MTQCRWIAVFLGWMIGITQISAAAQSDLLYSTLKGGSSIRAASMGGAFTAVAEEGASFSYNPAGLALPGASFRTENLDYNHYNTTSFGANYAYLSPFGIGKWRQEQDGNSAEVTGYGFGRHGARGVDWGVLYKTVSYSSLSAGTNGWSTDIGVLLRLAPFMDIGFAAQDVLKKDVSVPATFRAGIALFNPAKELTLTTDFVVDRFAHDEIHVVAGGEYQLTDGIRLRGGLNRDAITGGVALSLPILEVEYGFSSERNAAGGTTHMLGFKFGRGPTPTTSRRQYTLFKPSAFAEFSVASNVVEGKSEFALINGSKIGSNDLIGLIRQASDDETCEGFIIRIGDLSGSLATIAMVQEIRSELEKSKKKGKYIAVYLDGWAALPEYYLASIADKIVMPELGSIGYLGIKLDVLKMKYFYNNFGINDTVVQSGKYKTSLYPTSPTISESERVVLEDMVNDLYRQVLVDIKASRKIDWIQISDVFDGHMITAHEAKEMGLIDAIGYLNDLVATVSMRGGKKTDVEDIQNFIYPNDPPSIFSAYNRIAVIEVDGEIMDGKLSADYLFGNKATGAENIEEISKKIRDDVTVRGVILRINSPGGSMLGSDRILAAVEGLKKTGRPVYASMGNIAASGGYYVAMSADRIFANPATLTGSIGVVSVYRNYAELNSLLDIRHDVIKTGRYMDAMDANSITSSEDIKMVDAYQDKMYQIFRSKLRDRRKLSEVEVDQIAQGQVILGEDAQRLKIVDELGNFYTAVDQLSKRVNIKAPELVFYRPQEPFFAPFLGRSLESVRSWVGIN
jgi:protease-4